MPRHINNLSIRTKLVLIYVLPAVALLLVTAGVMKTYWDSYRGARVAQEILGTSLDITETVYELQKERGLSAGYLGSGGKQFGDDLGKQRARTSRSIQSLKGFFSRIGEVGGAVKMRPWIKAIEEELDKRIPVLAKIDTVRNDDGFWTYYSKLIARIIGLYQRVPLAIDDPEFHQLVRAYGIILWLEERAGQERGRMNGVMTSGVLHPLVFQEISGYITRQETLFAEFKAIAEPGMADALNAVLTDTLSGRVQEIRSSVVFKLQKNDSLNLLQSHLGYGGFIHDYKNYVLRGVDAYGERVKTHVANAREVIREYAALPGIGGAELNALSVINDTIAYYLDNLETIKRMHGEGRSIIDIDQFTTVEDGAALDAVQILRKNISTADAEEWFSLATARIDKINEVRSAFKISVIAYAARYTRNALLMLTLMGLMSVAVIGVSIFIASLVANRLSRGIEAVAATLGRVQEKGEFTERVIIEGTDEIAFMAQAINRHLAALGEAFTDINNILESGAKGNFENRVEGNFKGDLRSLKDGVNRFTDEIKKTIEELTQAEAKVRTAKNEADLANQAKSEFLANMSHDLRTPLNAIIGFSEMMECQTFGPLGDSHYDEYIRDILNSGKFLVSLIDDILNLSKIEAGKYFLVEGDIDFGSLVNVSVNMIAPQAEAANIRLTTAIPPDLPSLHGDDRALTQIINNLLSNAVKFCDGKGSVSISAGINGEGALEACIKDDGVGMSKDDLALAVKPFVQTDSTISHKHKGTGLGLYLCNKFMEMHGGTLGIESEIGKGTTATLRFPPERTVARGDTSSSIRAG